MKLKRLTLQNFRAFHDEDFMDFTKDNNPKNVLIYGENGSGKSSLFWALHSFVNYFKDEDKSKHYFNINHEKCLQNIFNESDDGHIKVLFDELDEFEFNKNGLRDEIKTKLINLSRVKSFLTYKDLLGIDMMQNSENSAFARKILLELLTGDVSLVNENGTQIDSKNRIDRVTLLLQHPIEITYYKNLIDFKNLLFSDIENLEFLYSSEVGDFEIEDKEGDVVGLEFNAFSKENFEQLKSLDSRINSFIEYFHSIFEDEVAKTEFLDNWRGSLSEIEKFMYESEDLKEKAEMYRYIDPNAGDAQLESYIDIIETTLDDIEDNVIDESFRTKFTSIFSLDDSVEKLYSDWQTIKSEIDTRVDNINDNARVYCVNKLLGNLGYENIKVVVNIDYDLPQFLKFDVELNGREINTHHKFLNEAKLSAINLAFYFSVILSYTRADIPLLILDDLLISLDMNNREKVLNLLTDSELFLDYQIVLLTHERAFFDMAKHKLNYVQSGEWIYYEMYVDDSGEIEKPFIKKSKSYLDRAYEEFLNRNYDCSANLSRKACEALLFQYLPNDKKFSSTCDKLQFNNLLQNARSQEQHGSNIELFNKLDTFRMSIFNPQSHSDDMEVYREELKDAINTVKTLKEVVEGASNAT